MPISYKLYIFFVWRMDDCPILLNESVFDDVCIPDKLAGRDDHVKEIARSLEPARSDRQITNLFIHGPLGVGKTVVCKWF